LKAFQADGQEIGGHTINHLDLTTLTPSQQEHEVCDDRTQLIAWGFNPTSFAYPFGAFNASAESVIKNCGYTSPDSIKSDTSLEQIEQYVTTAQQNGGGWIPFVFHHVCSGSSCDLYSITPDTLSGFMEWLQTQASVGTVVETTGQVINPPRLIRPPRPWPIPFPPRPPHPRPHPYPVPGSPISATGAETPQSYIPILSNEGQNLLKQTDPAGFVGSSQLPAVSPHDVQIVPR
jgi:hypothetical protein